MDLWDNDVTWATLPNMDKITSHVLVFLVKSVMNPLSHSLATFSTDGMTSYQMFPLFWRAVAILELTCNLKVIAATSDVTSPNRKFYKMHSAFDTNAKNITYRIYMLKMVVIFSSFLMLHTWLKPHAVTFVIHVHSRNSRYMWNNNHHLWSHISQMYYLDLEIGSFKTDTIFCNECASGNTDIK